MSGAAGRTWGGTYAYRAARLHRPAGLDDVRRLAATAPRLRVLGTRHAFSDIADADELLTLAGLPPEIVVDREAMTVSLGGGATYADLIGELRAHDVALHNLASLPHISVAGAVATATHGSGDAAGNLATAVAALELVTSDGSLMRVARGDPDFEGMVVGLGALGVVTRLTLDVEPGYDVVQRVYDRPAWEPLLASFGDVMAAGDSVSVFSRLGAAVEQVWVKRRATAGPLPDELVGAPAATVERHPILTADPVHATPGLGVPGPWWDRLPHFRAGFIPSGGEELQSEFLVPRQHAVDAIRAMVSVGEEIGPLILTQEIRTIAADRLWMSPQFGQETVGLHFTWRPDPEAVRRALAVLEPALEPFAPRAHWGKVFLAEAAALAPRYPRHPEWVALRERLDPRAAFCNAWLERCVLGEAG